MVYNNNMEKDSTITKEYVSLVEKINSYLPDFDEDLFRKAYEFAYNSHRGQKRDDEKDYFTHPYAVTEILTSLKLDETTLIAGLLHDTLEDTDITYKDIESEFGKEVAEIVEGVTKLEKVDSLNGMDRVELQAGYIRKMFFAMAKDLRVILVKLADRLHNMRTIEYRLSSESRARTARETLDIYAPLAHRLGMFNMKAELEDLGFKELHTYAYREIKEKVREKLEQRQKTIGYYKGELEKELERQGIEAEVYGRVKHFYSIYMKMKKKHREFDEIYDLIALRVIVEDVNACYGVLGIVHSIWKPITGRFKDYIAVPKSNGYRSLHTTVVTDKGERLEIQIRSRQMHQEAEFGLAAHWAYKSGISPEKELKWLRQIIDWQKEYLAGRDYLGGLKKELELDEVFVFTPRGELKHLPKGSTVIDFAYAIHTDVGNHCVGGKINRKLVPLTRKLQDGDVVEIIVDKNSKGPSKDWLSLAYSPRTRAKIKRFFREAEKEKLIKDGRDILRRELKQYHLTFKILETDEGLKKLLEGDGIKDIDDLCSRIGRGTYPVNKIINALTKKENEPQIKSVELREEKGDVIVDGLKGIAISIAKCCYPVPGDDIVGIVTKTKGISVHRKGCVNTLHVSKDRFVNVRWSNAGISRYTTRLHIEMENKGDALAGVVNRLNEKKIPIIGMNMKPTPLGTISISIDLGVKDSKELKEAVQSIKKDENVLDVNRIRRG